MKKRPVLGTGTATLNARMWIDSAPVESQATVGPMRIGRRVTPTERVGFGRSNRENAVNSIGGDFEGRCDTPSLVHVSPDVTVVNTMSAEFLKAQAIYLEKPAPRSYPYVISCITLPERDQVDVLYLS